MKTTKEIAKHIAKDLSSFEKQYAFKNGGFKALHDLMDANNLLPESDDIDLLNEVIEQLDRLLLVY